MVELFNTLVAARKLQEAGCDQALAEEMASQIYGAISGTVATKADIELLQSDIKRLEDSTKAVIKPRQFEFKRVESSFEANCELLLSYVTKQLWLAVGTFLVIVKALDYLLPAVGG